MARRLPGAAALLALAAILAWSPFALLAGLAAGAVAASATAWPALALALVALAVPFGSLAAMPLGGAAVTAAPVLVALATAGRVGAGLARRQLWRPPARVLWPALPYLGALALSAWWAPDWPAAAIETARWVVLALTLVLAAGLSGREARWVLLALLLAGAVEAVVGIRQALAGLGPEAFLLPGGRARAFGDFAQPNPFAGYMNLVWPVGLALALPALAWRRPHAWGALDGWLAAAGLATAGLAGVALVLSWSRGAWLAAAAGAAAMGVVWLAASLRPPVRPLMLAGLLGLAVAGLALLASERGARLPGGIAARLGSVSTTFSGWDVADAEVHDANFATVERLAHWQAAVAMWADRPWLGQGPGHYEAAYGRYRLNRWAAPLGHAHNYYLHALAETGLAGLVTFLLLLGATVAYALRAALTPRTWLAARLAPGVVGVLAALATHSLTDNLFVHDMTAQVGLLWGLLIASGDHP